MRYNLSLDDAKAFAKRLSAYIGQSGCQLKHTQSLEAVAAMLGYRNFNTLRADLSEPASRTEDERIEGPDRLTTFFEQVFRVNHSVPTLPNPQCIYLPAYTTGHLNNLESRARRALTNLGREFIFVDALDMTALGICEAITQESFRNAGQAFNAVETLLSDTSTVLLIKGLSESKMNQKGGFARDLIKTLDDAHIFGRRQDGDVVFIDYASFLEKHWQEIGPYLSINTVSYPWEE